MANPNIKEDDKTLNVFINDYTKNFCPFDIREKAQRDISKLYQKLEKDEDGTPNNGFQNYINKFQNIATKAKFEDNLMACTQFSAGLDQQISTIILSMTTPPDILEEWLDKAKPFHSYKLRIDDLQSRNRSYIPCPYQNSFSWTPCDPNTMEVDFIKLKKLTLQKHAKYMREGQCFKYRKISHDARNCRSSSQSQKNPSTSQQIHHIKDTPIEKPVTSTFSAYTHTVGKSEDELLQTLKLCYKEPNEEVRITTTFQSDKEGFWNGKLLQHHLPIVSIMYS